MEAPTHAPISMGPHFLIRWIQQMEHFFAMCPSLILWTQVLSKNSYNSASMVTNKLCQTYEFGGTL
jgi:hypothetical protein